MKWEISGKFKAEYLKKEYPGKCPFSNKDAIVVVHCSKAFLSKYDLQKTTKELGRDCSLLDGKNHTCLYECRLVTEKF